MCSLILNLEFLECLTPSTLGKIWLGEVLVLATTCSQYSVIVGSRFTSPGGRESRESSPSSRSPKAKMESARVWYGKLGQQGVGQSTFLANANGLCPGRERQLTRREPAEPLSLPTAQFA